MKKKRPTKLFHTATTFVTEIDISNDFLVTFAEKPMFQFTFATNEGDLELLLQKFREKICRVLRWRDESGLTLQQAVLKFDKTVFVHLRNCPCPCVHVYADTAIRAEALEKKIRAVLPPTVKKADEPFFFMLRREGTTVMPQKVTNTVAPMDDESMRLCYGEDVLNWVDGFADQTSKKLGGITILDGPPGVGKSTLISQLMRRLYQTHAFYVLSVAQHESLSNESMVEFWQEQNGRRPNEIKVVIMEDAEKILLQRRSDNDEAVSALLNIADGLMAKCYVCTFFAHLIKAWITWIQPCFGPDGYAAIAMSALFRVRTQKNWQQSTSCLSWRTRPESTTPWPKSSMGTSTNRIRPKSWVSRGLFHLRNRMPTNPWPEAPSQGLRMSLGLIRIGA